MKNISRGSQIKCLMQLSSPIAYPFNTQLYDQRNWFLKKYATQWNSHIRNLSKFHQCVLKIRYLLDIHPYRYLSSIFSKNSPYFFLYISPLPFPFHSTHPLFLSHLSSTLTHLVCHLADHHPTTTTRLPPPPTWAPSVHHKLEQHHHHFLGILKHHHHPWAPPSPEHHHHFLGVLEHHHHHYRWGPTWAPPPGANFTIIGATTITVNHHRDNVRRRTVNIALIIRT